MELVAPPPLVPLPFWDARSAPALSRTAAAAAAAARDACGDGDPEGAEVTGILSAPRAPASAALCATAKYGSFLALYRIALYCVFAYFKENDIKIVPLKEMF